jgi:hypothetical protein
MTLEDIDLNTSETQQGNKGIFRMTALDRQEHNNWLYTFKNEDGTFFRIKLDRFGLRTIE